jgi:hypothetical protein
MAIFCPAFSFLPLGDAMSTRQRSRRLNQYRERLRGKRKAVKDSIQLLKSLCDLYVSQGFASILLNEFDKLFVVKLVESAQTNIAPVCLLPH